MIGIDLMVIVLAVMVGVLVALAIAVGGRKAVRQLGEHRRRQVEEEIRPHLLDLLVEGDEGYEGEAGEGEAGEGEAGEGRERVRAAYVDAADWFSRLPPQTGRTLESMMIDMLPKVRGQARARIVELLVERGTVERKIKRLGRPGSVGRAGAAAVLGRLAAPQARAALLRCLDDRDRDVRIVAGHALATSLTSEVVERLLASLDGPKALPFGLVATDLLGVGQDAVEPVVHALRSGQPNAREAAAEILGLRGVLPAVTSLCEVLADRSSPDGLRVRAARALGRLGSPVALDVLLDAVGPDQPAQLRVAAARALGDLDDPDAVERLVDGLSASEHVVAAASASALAALGTEGAEALKAVRRDRDGELPGRYAAAALATLAVSGAGRGATVPAGA